MHEYHAVEKLVKEAIKIAQEKGLEKVSRVRLAIGDASGLEEGAVKLYFDQIAEKTVLEGAEVEFSRIPVLLRCEKCAKDFTFTKSDFNCPFCKTPSRNYSSGKASHVESIF